MVDAAQEIQNLIAGYLKVTADLALDVSLISVKLQKLGKQFELDFNAIIQSAQKEAEAEAKKSVTKKPDVK